MSTIKPKRKETYDVLDKNGLRHLTQLRLGLNPLKFYKFKHNFLDTHDPMCLIFTGRNDKEIEEKLNKKKIHFAIGLWKIS